LGDVHVEIRPFFMTSYAAAREVLFLARLEREALAAGVPSPPEIRYWQDTLRQADVMASFFVSEFLALAAGRKP
jgi:hypothetical protein